MSLVHHDRIKEQSLRSGLEETELVKGCGDDIVLNSMEHGMCQHDHYTLSRGTSKAYLNLVIVHGVHNSQNHILSLPRNSVWLINIML